MLSPYDLNKSDNVFGKILKNFDKGSVKELLSFDSSHKILHIQLEVINCKTSNTLWAYDPLQNLFVMGGKPKRQIFIINFEVMLHLFDVELSSLISKMKLQVI